MERYKGPPSPKLPQEYEIVLVKEHILLRAVQDLIAFEIKKLKQAPGLRMTDIYVRKLKQCMDIVINAQYVNRRTFKEAGIKIFEIERSREMGGGLRTAYIIRGYEYEMLLLPDLLKAECEIRMAEFLQVDLTNDRYAEKEE